MNNKLLLLGSLCALSTTAAQAAQKSERPNILVIMADDMGYGDAGFTGCTDINTPNLDALAASGAIMTQGYATHSFSSPSRAALMSGCYPHRFGYETNPAYDPANTLLGINPDIKLFPERLQEVGYKTGIIGKWHLGASELHNPLVRGFDYFYGFLGGGHNYSEVDITAKVDEGYKLPLIRNYGCENFEGYITDVFSEDAVNFVNDSKDEPFFLYLAYNAPHGPIEAPEDEMERYSNIENVRRRTYATMVDIMDRGIGQVIQALKDNGLYENTIIFFMSDNGGPLEVEGNPWAGNASCNFPYRAGKGSFYEGGIHIPFVVSWPGVIDAGSTFDYPVNSLDVSRTSVAVAGGDATSAQGMEGADLIPFLTGESDGAPHDAIYWRGGDGAAWAIIASDGIKQVKTNRSNPNPELYNLRRDEVESKDITAKNATKAEELTAMWDEWNSKNIPSNMFNYSQYHKIRDEFFKSAIPETAK